MGIGSRPRRKRHRIGDALLRCGATSYPGVPHQALCPLSAALPPPRGQGEAQVFPCSLLGPVPPDLSLPALPSSLCPPFSCCARRAALPRHPSSRHSFTCLRCSWIPCWIFRTCKEHQQSHEEAVEGHEQECKT